MRSVKEMFVLCLFAILATSVAGPVRDSQIVGSVIREVRALAPEDLAPAGKHEEI